MPVTNQGEDKDQEGNHQQASSFQCINLRRAMVFGRGRLRLTSCSSGGHAPIVVPAPACDSNSWELGCPGLRIIV